MEDITPEGNAEIVEATEAALDAAAGAASEPKTWPIEVTLSDGRKASLRKGKGRDLLAAQRMSKSPDDLQLSLVSVLTSVDGQRLVFEDVLDMDLSDVLNLLGLANGGHDFLSRLNS